MHPSELLINENKHNDKEDHAIIKNMKKYKIISLCARLLFVDHSAQCF